MVKLVRSSFIKSSLLALTLGGCIQQPPGSIFLDVSNTSTSVSEEVGAPMACEGGVKASLSLAGITVTTGLAYPPSEGEEGADSPSAQMDVPASVRFGMPLVTEAWCYDGADGELGYAKVDKPLRNRYIPVVNVLAPLKAKPTFDEASECVAPTEQRGVELCVKSDLY